MNRFFTMQKQMDMTLSDNLSNYKIPLSNIASLLGNQGFDTANVYPLIQGIQPNLSPDFYDEIYAILPIQEQLFKRTIVLYKDYFMYVEMTPFNILKRVLAYSPLLNFQVYTKTLQQLFKCKTTIIPVATDYYSLIPLGPVRSKDTIWINPGKVECLKNQDLKTLLLLENRFPISSDRLVKSISRRMLKGFLAHAILKREIDPRPVRPSMDLLEYLELPSTPAIRKVLRRMQFQHIPNLQGEFFVLYNKVHQQLIKENLLSDLDIEE